jgi:hypothetical protein
MWENVPFGEVLKYACGKGGSGGVEKEGLASAILPI